MKTFHSTKTLLLLFCCSAARMVNAQSCYINVGIYTPSQLGNADRTYLHCCPYTYNAGEARAYYTLLPAYNDKLLYIDPDTRTAPSFYLPTWYPAYGNTCSGTCLNVTTANPGRIFSGGSFRKANDYRVVYKYDNPYYNGQDASQGKGTENGTNIINGVDFTSITYYPASAGVGTRTIWLVDFYEEDWGRNHSAHDYHYAYSKFNITVEMGPQWLTNLPFQNVCANDNTQYNLASYVTNTSGVSFTIDGQPATYFQPSAWAPGQSHTLTLHKTYNNGAYSKNYVVTIMQAAPVVNTAAISVKKSCGGPSSAVMNGQIVIPAGTISTNPAGGNIRWILKKGSGSDQPCKIDFLTPVTSNCGIIEQWSQGDVPSGNAITISNLPAQSYSLWIVNAGESSGNCYQAIPITVGQYDPLQLSLDNAQTRTISCNNASDGQIRVYASGGDLDAADNGRYSFTLTSNGNTINAPIIAQDANSITWGSLPAGNYTATVHNTCQPDQSVAVTLPDVIKVNGTVQYVQPTCSSPGNGSITVKATAGMGNYQYTLYKDGVQTAQATTTATQYVFSNISGGNYTVTIKDADRLSCDGFTQAVAIPLPVALSAQLLGQQNASCFNYSDARLSFSASGGMGSYSFSLSNGGPAVTNSTGNFTGLSQGSYTLTLRNSDAGCADQFTAVFPITQPAALTVSLQPHDVSCNGEGDGSINALPAGGSGSYGYTWQVYSNNTWQTDHFNTTANSTGLTPGTYRLIINDPLSDAACMATSAAVVIKEAPPLHIDQVKITDAVCLSDGAPLQITVSGGNGNNRFTYNIGAGDVAFNNSTALHQSGNYYFKVTDQNGCTDETPNAYNVVLPSAPLAFTYTANNISCNGLTDGSIALNPTGGNGDVYSGYAFKIAGPSYQKDYASVTAFTQLPAGNYVVTLKDGRGCEVSQNITLTQPQVLRFASANQDIACYGASTGSITPAITGGSLPYTITMNGDAVNNNQPLSQLPAGDYVFDVKDAHGCALNQTVTLVNSYPALKLDKLSVYDIHCYNSQGHVTIQASGGDGAYQYQWSTDNWQTVHHYLPADSLPAGNYRFRLQDGQGCITPITDAISITAPTAPLSVTALLSDYNGVNISCYGGANGSIQLDASGGNGATYANQYTYALDDASRLGSSNTFSQLKAGNYTVYIQDARGCVLQQPVQLTQSGQQVSISLVQQDIRCYGDNSGSITATPVGGVAPYQFSINQGSWSAQNSFNQLPAGSYEVQLRDVNGCPASGTVQLVNLYAPLQVTDVHFADIVCYNGKATIQPLVNGGDGQYHYWFSSNNGATYTEQTIFDQFTPAVYTVKVTDGQGCTTQVPGSFAVTHPAQPLDFNFTLSDYNGYNISCYGGSNGFASINPAGGNGATYNGYWYALDNAAFTTDNTLRDIAAGNHQLHLKDARGCLVTKQVSFTQSSLQLIVSLVSKQDIKCGNDKTGSISVSGNGGVGHLRYALNGGAPQDSPVFDRLGAGNYVVAVLDDNNCNNAIQVTINSAYPTIVMDSIQVKDIVCQGDQGSINIFASGGNNQYSYEYSLDGQAYTGFPASHQFDEGQYTVRVKDGVGCYADPSKIISITRPQLALDAAVVVSDYHGVNISCYGLQDGNVALSAFGGNDKGYAGYWYALNDGPYQTSEVFASLKAGDYRLSIKDARGCVIHKIVTLLQPPAPLTTALLASRDVVCAGDASGVIQMNSNGGTLPYRYAIDNNWQTSNSFASLKAGDYTVQVQDVNGCAASYSTVIKELYAPIAATVKNTPVSCFGLSNGALAAAITGGDGQYRFQWLNRAETTPQLQQLPAGDYQLTVTDGHACSKQFNYTVTQPKTLLLALTTTPICDATNSGVITCAATGGTLPYLYSLNNADWLSSPVFNGLTNGSYTVTVKDSNACTYTTPITIARTNVKPDINFLVASRQNARDTLVIKEISNPAPDSLFWSYDPQAIVISNNPDSPQIRFARDGTYWVEMKGYFSGCAYSLRKNIIVNPYDPNAGPSYVLPVNIIDTVGLYPNPNSGQFQFKIKLNRKQAVIVTVISNNGTWMAQKEYDRTDLVDDKMTLGNIAAGTYIFRVITENESRDVIFVVGK